MIIAHFTMIHFTNHFYFLNKNYELKEIKNLKAYLVILTI